MKSFQGIGDDHAPRPSTEFVGSDHEAGASDTDTDESRAKRSSSAASGQDTKVTEATTKSLEQTDVPSQAPAYAASTPKTGSPTAGLGPSTLSSGQDTSGQNLYLSDSADLIDRSPSHPPLRTHRLTEDPGYLPPVSPTTPPLEAPGKEKQKKPWHAPFTKWLSRDKSPTPEAKQSADSQDPVAARLRSRKVVPGPPRPPTFVRQESERPERLMTVDAQRGRKAISNDQRRPRVVSPTDVARPREGHQIEGSSRPERVVIVEGSRRHERAIYRSGTGRTEHVIYEDRSNSPGSLYDDSPRRRRSYIIIHPRQNRHYNDDSIRPENRYTSDLPHTSRDHGRAQALGLQAEIRNMEQELDHRRRQADHATERDRRRVDKDAIVTQSDQSTSPSRGSFERLREASDERPSHRLLTRRDRSSSYSRRRSPPSLRLPDVPSERQRWAANERRQRREAIEERQRQEAIETEITRKQEELDHLRARRERSFSLSRRPSQPSRQLSDGPSERRRLELREEIGDSEARARRRRL